MLQDDNLVAYYELRRNQMQQTASLAKVARRTVIVLGAVGALVANWLSKMEETSIIEPPNNIANIAVNIAHVSMCSALAITGVGCAASVGKLYYRYREDHEREMHRGYRIIDV